MKNKRMGFSCISWKSDGDGMAKEKVLEILNERLRNLECESALQKENLEVENSEAMQQSITRKELMDQWKRGCNKIHKLLVDLQDYEAEAKKVAILEMEKKSIADELRMEETQLRDLHCKLNKLQKQGLQFELHVYHKEKRNERVVDSTNQRKMMVKDMLSVAEVENVIYGNKSKGNVMNTIVTEKDKNSISPNEAFKNLGLDGETISTSISLEMEEELSEWSFQDYVSNCNDNKQFKEREFTYEDDLKKKKGDEVLLKGRQILELERTLSHHKCQRDLLVQKTKPLKADIVKLSSAVQENEMIIKSLFEKEDIMRGFTMKCAFLENDIKELVQNLNEKREEIAIVKRKLFVFKTKIISLESSHRPNKASSVISEADENSQEAVDMVTYHRLFEDVMRLFCDGKVSLSHQPKLQRENEIIKKDPRFSRQWRSSPSTDGQLHYNKNGQLNGMDHLKSTVSSSDDWALGPSNLDANIGSEADLQDHKTCDCRKNKKTMLGKKWRKKTKEQKKIKQHKACPSLPT